MRDRRAWPGRPVRPRGKPHETSARRLLALPFTYLLPLALLKLYQLIPPGHRSGMLPGPSASQAAIEELKRTGNGWQAIRRHARIRW